jgi:3-oxoacyl-[acyl-carrier protein] reductase
VIDPQLDGKVALVTGANHGIGAATAKALAAQGARVFITYFLPDCPYSDKDLEEARRAGIGGDLLYRAKQQQSADAVVHEIKSCHGEAVAQEFDLGEAANVPRLFDVCESKIGPVDILINNHTHCILETFDPALVRENLPEICLTNSEGIDRHFAVNARACALMMREYLKRHIAREARWGRIVSITTVLAHSGNISYAASKRALVSYTLSAAREMGKYGITANVVCPGATQTGYLTPENERQEAARTPLRRIGQPKDVADVILFLASEQGRWVTGELIHASGGYLMYMRE